VINDIIHIIRVESHVCSIARLWCVSTAQLLASINILFTFVVGSVR